MGGIQISLLPRNVVLQLPLHPMGRSLFLGMVWTAASMIGSRFLLMFGMVVLAHTMDRSTFGQFGLIQQFVLLSSILLSYSLGLTGARFLAEYRLTDRSRAGRILQFSLWAVTGLSVCFGCFTVATSSWLARDILQEPLLTTPLMLCVPWMISSSINLTIQGCLTGLMTYRTMMIVQLIEAGVGVVLGCWGAIHWGLSGAILGFEIGAIVSCLLSIQMLRAGAIQAEIPFRVDCWRDVFHEGWKLRNFWIPSLISAVVYCGSNWLSPVLLVRQANGFTELAAFYIANFWFNAIGTLPNLLQRVGTVVASSMGANSQLADAAFRMTLRINFLLMGIVTLPLAVLSPWLMGLYGTQFQDSWPTLILCLGTVQLLGFIKPGEQKLIVLGRLWEQFGLTCVMAVSYVTLSIWASPYGSIGLAGARLVAFLLQAALLILAIRPHSGCVASNTTSEQVPHTARAA